MIRSQKFTTKGPFNDNEMVTIWNRYVDLHNAKTEFLLPMIGRYPQSKLHYAVFENVIDENTVKLSDYLNMISDNIYNRLIASLVKIYIFGFGVTFHNVILNKKTKQMYIIDIEDSREDAKSSNDKFFFLTREPVKNMKREYNADMVYKIIVEDIEEKEKIRVLLSAKHVQNHKQVPTLQRLPQDLLLTIAKSEPKTLLYLPSSSNIDWGKALKTVYNIKYEEKYSSEKLRDCYQEMAVPSKRLAKVEGLPYMIDKSGKIQNLSDDPDGKSLAKLTSNLKDVVDMVGGYFALIRRSDGTIYRALKMKKHVIKNSPKNIVQMDFSYRGLLLRCADGKVYTGMFKTYNQLKGFRLVENIGHAIHISTDGKFSYICCSDGKIYSSEVQGPGFYIHNKFARYNISGIPPHVTVMEIFTGARPFLHVKGSDGKIYYAEYISPFKNKCESFKEEKNIPGDVTQVSGHMFRCSDGKVYYSIWDELYRARMIYNVKDIPPDVVEVLDSRPPVLRCADGKIYMSDSRNYTFTRLR